MAYRALPGLLEVGAQCPVKALHPDSDEGLQACPGVGVASPPPDLSTGFQGPCWCNPALLFQQCPKGGGGQKEGESSTAPCSTPSKSALTPSSCSVETHGLWTATPDFHLPTASSAHVLGLNSRQVRRAVRNGGWQEWRRRKEPRRSPHTGTGHGAPSP